MREISFRQLRAVLAVSRTGKIVLAANELGLTQPAVTVQLHRVEEAIGAKLFDRATDGMHATQAGLAVIEAAKEIEDRLVALADEVDAINGLRKGSLRLGVVSTAKYFATALMAAFMR